MTQYSTHAKLYLLLYSITIFLGAFLLFFIQPLVAKSVLPVLGGAPQVWNTCVLFFQVVLLLGYAYAHWLTTLNKKVWQILIHALVIVLPFAFIPFDSVATEPVNQSIYPAIWLLGTLAFTVGVPFFVVSTVSPLLQKWFASQQHSESGDPYFLYASSNLGSMLGLIAFSFVVEPRYTLMEQNVYWYGGYVAFFVFISVILGLVARQYTSERSSAVPSVQADVVGNSNHTYVRDKKQVLRWLVLSFAPSSLMLGVTQYLSTDIASVPLIWIIPLALYLFTYSLAFSRSLQIPVETLGRILGILLLVLVLLLIAGVSRPIAMIASLHLVVFFLVSLLCHKKLALSRPHTTDLTVFYLVIALGGVLGGMVNGLLSPVIFNDVWEYPIALLLGAALALSRRDASSGGPTFNKYLELMLPLLPAVTMVLLASLWAWIRNGADANTNDLLMYQTPIVIGLPIIISYLFVRIPVRYVIALAGCIVVGVTLYANSRGEILFQKRSYFGVHRVVQSREDVSVFQLFHGQTLHGSQLMNNRTVATGYYHATGPAGQVLQHMSSNSKINVGLVGLGVGTLAAFAQAGDHYSFFEIDPVVAEVADNQAYFTFLQDARSRQADIRVELGDARLSIAREDDNKFDILVLDAFSSDAVPIHLLTIEALKMYISKSNKNGILLFHLSNDYLDLVSILARQSVELGYSAYVQRDIVWSIPEENEQKLASQWVALIPGDSVHAGYFTSTKKWKVAKAPNTLRAWTDSYSNLFQIVRW